MIAGSLELQMYADLSRLSKDMADAKRIVGDGMGKVEQSVAAATSALRMLGGVLSVGAFTAWIKGSIDAADNLNDLRKSTSLTVEQLAGLQFASRQSGGELQGTADAINKLSLNMGKHAEKFAAIGVTAKDPIEAFKQLSDIFVSIEDPQQRAAFAAEALGKSWASAAPLLSEGSANIQEMIDKGARLSGVTQEMADQADAFNDSIVVLQARMAGMATEIAGDLLPILLAMGEPMNSLATDAKTADDGFSPLAETLRAVTILGGNVAFVFKAMGTELGGLTAQMAAFASGNFEGAAAIGESMKKDAIAAREAFDIWEQGVLNAGKGGGSNRGGVGANSADEMVALMEANAKREAAKKAKGVAGFIGSDNVDKVKKEDIAGPEIPMAEFVKRQGEAEFMGPMIEAWDLQVATAAAKEQEKQDALYKAHKEGIEARGELADEDRMARDELEMLRMEEAILLEDERRAVGLINEQTFQDNISAIRFKAAMTSSTQIAQIQAAAAGWEKFSMMERTKFGLNMAEQLTAGLAGQSRKMFEAHKAASIGQALMNTYEGATKALSQGGIWGAVMMAAVLAIGVAQVAKIRSQQFGGGAASGGSVGSFPTAASLSQSTTFSQNENGAPPVPVTLGKAEAPRTQVNVTLVGSAFDYNTVATQLIPLLNDAAANGAEIRVSQG